MVPIVQLVRASDCGSECRRFESDWVPSERDWITSLFLFYGIYPLIFRTLNIQNFLIQRYSYLTILSCGLVLSRNSLWASFISVPLCHILQLPSGSSLFSFLLYFHSKDCEYLIVSLLPSPQSITYSGSPGKPCVNKIY